MGVAAALLAGCGGSQPPIGAPGAMPQSRAIAQQAARGKSWMLPEAKHEDLLYVSATNQYYMYQTYVYAYKTQKLVGILSGVTDPAGLCVDASGNVFVADEPSEIVEYAHGAMNPSRSVSVPESPLGCAVDPTSGDLAVTTEYRNIYVYKNGTGMPQSYALPKGQGMSGCGYDAHGNFFVVGWSQNSYRTKYFLFELPKGSSALIGIRLRIPELDFYDVKRDGKKIAVLSAPYIYRFVVKGKRGKHRGSTKVVGDLSFWLVPSHRQVLTAGDGGTVYYSTYPGGVFLSQLRVGGNNFNPAVSLARH